MCISFDVTPEQEELLEKYLEEYEKKLEQYKKDKKAGKNPEPPIPIII